MIWSSNCFSNMTVTEQLEYLYDKLESLDPSAAPDLTEIKQRLAKVEADIRRLDREIDNIDLSGINAEIEAIKNQLQTIANAQNTQAADIAALQSGKQDKLTAGDNITLTPQADGTVKISSTGGGGGGEITLDDTVTETSANGVKSSGIYTAIQQAKQDVQDNVNTLSVTVAEHTQDIIDLQNANTATGQTITSIQTTQQEHTTQIQALQTSDQQQESDLEQLTQRVSQQETTVQQLQTDVDAVETNVNAILGDYVKNTDYAPFVQQTNATLTEHTQQITDLTDDKQDKLVAGDNITLEPQTDGTVKISSTASGGGGGSAGEWIQITQQSAYNPSATLPGKKSATAIDAFVHPDGRMIFRGEYTTDSALNIGSVAKLGPLQMPIQLEEFIPQKNNTGYVQFPAPTNFAIYIVLNDKWRLCATGAYEYQSGNKTAQSFSVTRCYCVRAAAVGSTLRYIIW